MTVQEVFSNLGQRMVEGLMTHSQMVDYFNFLGLKGYAKCHKYHYFEENANYKRVGDYFIKHYYADIVIYLMKIILNCAHMLIIF